MKNNMRRQEDAPQFDVSKYLQLVIRRKWVIVFTSIAVLIGGFLFCLIAPRTYKASTLIVTVPQKVPETYVHSTVTGNSDERIRSILQEVTSRTSLEKLIKKYDLYPDLRNKYPLETVIENMKEDISIEQAKISNTHRSRRGSQFLAFHLIYEGRDPEKVAQVTNALANEFVEKNLKLRQTQAENTARFLDTQLKKVYVELKEREEKLKNYKLAHMGELPEQTPTNVATLTALQQQLQSLEENIRRAEDREILLRQQLSDEGIAMKSVLASQGKHSKTSVLSLPELKAKLKVLKSRYTNNHPDVIALERLIKERMRAQASGSANKDGSSMSDEDLTGNPALDALKFQLKSAQLEIKQLKAERQKLKEQIARYQKRIEDAPKREQELIDLTRDYENLKQTYDSLLQRKLEAEQAAALERRQQGAQFKIVDPATVPEKPEKPKLKKLLPIIFVLAFGGAFGLAFALDFISPRFYDPDDITGTFGIPVLACIPLLLSEEEKRRKRKKTVILATTAVFGYLCAFSLFALVILKGPGAYSFIL